MTVELVELTADNLNAVMDLQVAASQAGLVASNAESIAEASFEPQAWCRAIYGNGVPVGFVLLYEDSDSHFLWRFMIDAAHQRRGFGAAALQLIIERARATAGVTSVGLSYADRPGNAGAFYRRLGFRETGAVADGEVVMQLALT